MGPKVAKGGKKTDIQSHAKANSVPLGQVKEGWATLAWKKEAKTSSCLARPSHARPC